jgi:xanthine dehydrogenase YagR molybdenum-binding subunit
MRDGYVLIGYGVATAVYPTERSAGSVSTTIFANDTVLVRNAASVIGPGTYTSMTQVAAETPGLPIDKVRVELGDTDMPKAPIHGGSITVASIGSAVQSACQALRAKLLAFLRETITELSDASAGAG